MLKIIKRIILSSLSILSISFICWLVVLLNPSFSYAHQTVIENVTVYHNESLEAETSEIIHDALEILKTADLYDEDIKIDLCMNDGSIYPELWIYKGATAYSFLNKAVIYNSQPSFENNYAEFAWEVNNFEIRRVNLTWLLAHEFTHNLQYNMDRLMPLKYEFWMTEGHAEYISHRWKGDGKLKEKIKVLLEEEAKSHTGVPVIKMEDGTVFTSLFYYQAGLLFQYLVEEKGMDFKRIAKEEKRPMEEVKAEMINWYLLTK